MNQAATTPAWVPAIAAIAALLGVLVAQFWQGRREEKRWKREQERWKLEREDQRQKDREAWAREDRHRFAEYKRELYADMLAQFTNYKRYLEFDVIGFGLPEHDEDDSAWMTVDGPPPELDQAVGLAQLVAPEEVRRQSLLYFHGLNIARYNVRIWNETTANETLRVIDIGSLRDAMRADLGEIPVNEGA